MMKNQILSGDVIEVAKRLLDQSVNCIVTSPPYFGLRDYGLPPTYWPEVAYAPMAGLPEITIPAMSCCLGLEDSIEAYVGHMVLVWRELWRVLRGDGVGWLNLGDSYSASGGHTKSGKNAKVENKMQLGSTSTPNGLKPKNLIGIPWRVAFALQADGWYLRSDVIWAKKNPMPESVRDRPTKAHEYLFLLAKSERYWWDQEAIREPGAMADGENRKGSIGKGPMTEKTGLIAGFNHSGDGYISNGSRNKRTVWPIATKPFPGAHFAVMPAALVEPCILAGCPAQVCAECGEPWMRVVEKGEPCKTGGGNTKSSAIGPMNRNGKSQWDTGAIITNRASITRGFTPTCQCSPSPDILMDQIGPLWPMENSTRPGIVLDPFFGSGTVAQVAVELKRDWCGIELNPKYIELARDRIYHTQPTLFAR